LPATLYAVRQTPNDAPLHIVCATPTLTNYLFKRLRRWEDKGWIGVAFAEYTRGLVCELRQRCAATTFRKQISGSEWHWLDKVRTVAQERDAHGFRKAAPPPPTNTTFSLSGAKLATATQAVVYAGIRQRKNIPNRRAATETIERIQALAVDRRGTEVPIPAIWTAVRHKDLRRPVADFIWRTMHGALRCGAFWQKVQGQEDRATCSVCDELDSIDHILFGCKAPGQREVWRSARALWAKKSPDSWTAPNLTELQAIGLDLHGERSVRMSPGTSRLWRIIVSEAVHVIWRLRCERVVGHAEDQHWRHTVPQVKGLWESVLQARLASDLEATRKCFGGLRRDTGLVLATWNKVIKDELALPTDWTRMNRFLVGSRPAVRLDFRPD
ncbi:hypothetical protein FOMPIDRAFT_57716, partial [Fomitopsis schrenkii]